MNEVKVALHDAVLARLAMNSDVGIVEEDALSVAFERKVVLVDGCRCTVVEVHMPVSAFHIDDVNIILRLVEKGIKALCRAQRDVVLR